MAGISPVASDVFFRYQKNTNGIPLNVTEEKAQNMGGILLFVVVADFLATMFLLTITYVTSAKDGMKLCEKFLVYNVLFTDLLMEVIVFVYIGPATLSNVWDPKQFDTIWMAFIHTFCMFHPHIAMATICYMIALSMTDAYRYEMANDVKHMSVLVISTLCLSICFCSLPATEDYGYTVLTNWMGPSFNINFQYGSLFMCTGVLGVVCGAMGLSILRLMEARRFFQENKARVKVRTLEEIDQDLVFCVISMVCACLLFPLIVGVPDPVLMFFPRVAMYMFPIIRVATLLTTCPIFQFAFFGVVEDVDDFAGLEGLDEHDAGDAGVAPIEAMIEERMADLDAMASVARESSESSEGVESRVDNITTIIDYRRNSTEL